MTDFVGTAGDDIANSALGELTGFTGGTVADLTDGVGDRFFCLDGDDFVFAGSANDIIEGGDGFDLLNGAEGNDTIYANKVANRGGSLIGDELVGNLGNDRLFGSSGADSLFGSEGDDDLIGGAGADQMFGEDGNDEFFFGDDSDLAGDIVDGGVGDFDSLTIGGTVNFVAAAGISDIEGITLLAEASVTFTAAQIKSVFNSIVSGQTSFLTTVSESLRIEMGADTSLDVFFTITDWGGRDLIEIVGDANSETIAATGFAGIGVPLGIRILGNGGNDTLTGGDGLDLLAGGTGNDVLIVTSDNDMLSGGDGLDTISWQLFASAITFALPEGGEGLGPSNPVGQVYLVGIENLTGGGGGDALTGNSGANTLKGERGDDTLKGGAGGDVLNGGTGIDTASYAGSTAGVTVNLTAGTASGGHAQGDTLSLIEGIVSTNFADTLTGNATANGLSGGGGNDELLGAAGRDTLAGGAGADDFNYASTTESGTTVGTRDQIVDFVHLSDDIDVSAIDARTGSTGNNAFSFIGQAAFSNEGQIRAIQSGANTVVEFNTSGASGAEMTIQLDSFTATTLTAADFLL